MKEANESHFHGSRKIPETIKDFPRSFLEVVAISQRQGIIRAKSLSLIKETSKIREMLHSARGETRNYICIGTCNDSIQVKLRQ